MIVYPFNAHHNSVKIDTQYIAISILTEVVPKQQQDDNGDNKQY